MASSSSISSSRSPGRHCCARSNRKALLDGMLAGISSVGGAFSLSCKPPAVSRGAVELLLTDARPETKARSLEELDAVFSVPTHEQVAHGLRQIPWFIQKYLFRRDVHLQPLIDFEKAHENAEEEEIFGGA